MRQPFGKIKGKDVLFLKTLMDQKDMRICPVGLPMRMRLLRKFFDLNSDDASP